MRGFFLKKKGDLSYSGMVAPPVAAAPGGCSWPQRTSEMKKEKRGKEEERERVFKK